MRRITMTVALGAGLLGLAAPAAAQTSEAREFLDRCREGGERERFCEVRPYELPATGELMIDAGPNGGIQVEGWDRDEVRVLALVRADGRTEAEAERLASEVRIETMGGSIRATGPSTRDRWSGWSVSFRVQAPRRTALELEAMNGGIRVEDVEGRLRLRTVNGGLTLEGVAGDVRAATTNGGVRVRLEGRSWRGAGLDVETTNGGITLHLPDDYSADLEVGTVNGSLSTDVPLRVQGRIDRRIETRLGAGGAPVRARTTNGSVRIATR